jgi:hypothetical protein
MMTPIEKYMSILQMTFPGQIALTLEQFCRVTGMTENSVRTLLSRGSLDLETIKPGKRRLIPFGEIAKFLAARTSPRRAA